MIHKFRVVPDTDKGKKDMANVIKMGKRLFCLFMFGMLTVTAANAQSKVYFFVRSVTSAEVKILKDGKEIFELRGPVKKTINPVGPMKLPSISYSAAYRECQFAPGNTVFSVEFDFTNVSTTSVKRMTDEIQLDLQDGDVHYVLLTFKGLTNIQLKELTEKDASKLLSDKKYVQLPDYAE